MIEQRSIDELTERSRVEDVVGQFVVLGQRGANRKGTCPFCGEAKKFSVSLPKQLYHCFHCEESGKGGLQFLMHEAGQKRGMDFKAAIQWLADHYHYELRKADGHGATESGGNEYFTTRMAELGYAGRDGEKGLFRGRTDGGIEIRYPALADGQWQQTGDADFVRIRLHPTKAQPGHKYDQPKGTGFRIFIPPVVVAEWRAGVKWETLFVVEGEFKAYAVARPGVPVVGIAGIKLYIAKKGSKDLHPDLVLLLRNAMAVSLVHDADAMEVRWDPESEPNKDLATRRRDFAGAVTGFRRAVGTLVPEVYYQRIDARWIKSAKGLDDLAVREGRDLVSSNLQALRTNSHFECFNITKEEWRGINGFFHLNMHRGVPNKFFEGLRDLIGKRPFVFMGGRYQYVINENTGEGNLDMLEHPDSKQYIAVGTDFYKKLYRPDVEGRQEPYLAKWTEANLQRNYVRNGVPKFLHTLDTYDDFTDVPGHHEDFREVVVVQPEEFGPSTRLRNRYHPLPIEPRKGDYPTIREYLKHVFGTEKVYTLNPKDGKVLAESENWQVYLDRWTIMYRMPYRRVPATVLGSEQHNTGKTTLLDLNQVMWGRNATIIGNEAVSDTFNSDWITKKYVGVDETLLAKQQDGEKLKGLITGKEIHERGMYQGREKRTNFTTFDLTTNHPDRFLPVGKDDMRWWVVIVPQYKTEDPHLLKKMVAELPALFYDLRRRDIIHPEMGRLWFANSVIDTKARQAAADQSRSWVEKELREWITEQFYAYQWPELAFSLRGIRKDINENNGARFRDSEIRDMLRKHIPCQEAFDRAFIPKLPKERVAQGQSPAELGEADKKGRWYLFRIEDWLPADRAKDITEQAKAEWAVSAHRINAAGEEFDIPLLWKK